MAQNTNIGETLCEAVDTLIKNRISSLAYDETEVCTIVDDTKREEGLYVVTNGSAKFEAYSTITTYRKDTVVYVSIPKGDMNEQKFIVGKKTNKSEQDKFTYQNPFSTLVDVTGNLIDVAIPTKGLVANDINTESIRLWSWDWPETGAQYNREKVFPIQEYSRLGIQAQFSTELNPFVAYTNEEQYLTRVVQGNYGLRLHVQGYGKTTESQKEDIITDYVFELDANDMIGNPYEFDTWYEQELVFDISQIYSIKRMWLEFYQISGTFADAKGAQRPYVNLEDGIDLGTGSVPPNLFMKDPYLCVGYDTSEFEHEKVVIYTLDKPTYIVEKEYKDQYKQHKKIDLRWIHEVENLPEGSDRKFISVNEETDLDENDYQIFWYKYEYGHASTDQYSGIYWKPLTLQDTWRENDESPYQTEVFFGADNEVANESRKSVQEARLNAMKREYEVDEKGNPTSNILKKSENENWLEYNANPAKDEDGNSVIRTPGYFYTWLIPDMYKNREEIRAAVFYKGKAYLSNILVIENETKVTNPSDGKLDAGLNIWCDDGTYGNYLIYNAGNTLVDEAQAHVDRNFRLYLNLPGAKEETESELTEARWVEWKVPINYTMLEFDDEDIQNQAYSQPVIKNYPELSAEDIKAGKKYLYKIITYYQDKETGKIVNTLPYRIKGKRSQSAGNSTMGFESDSTFPSYIGDFGEAPTIYNDNTVECRISYRSDEEIYETSKDLTFGQQGTVGTDVTFVIDFDKNIPAVTANGDKAVTVTARLYDYENKEVDLNNSNYTITWSWMNSSADENTTNSISFTPLTNEPYRCELKHKGSMEPPKYGILQAELKGWAHRTMYEVEKTMEKDEDGNDVVVPIQKEVTKEIPLTAYLPIPIRKSDDYVYASCPQSVMYDTAGYASDYYQNAIALYKRTSTPTDEEKEKEPTAAVFDTIEQLISCTELDVIINQTEDEKLNSYLPKIQKRPIVGQGITDAQRKNYFIPLNIFVEYAETNVFMSITDIDANPDTLAWIQPILHYQNKYPSKMLNDWDGSLTIDEANGAVLATKIAAGRKNDEDNTFTGVILGDWSEVKIPIVEDTSIENTVMEQFKEDESTAIKEYKSEPNAAEIATHTGLYGFDHGEQTFGFRDNGTAFIGKAGVGRIEFDGTHGYIQSSAYKYGKEGMRIDLQNNSLRAYNNFDLEAGALDAEQNDPAYHKYMHLTTKYYSNIDNDIEKSAYSGRYAFKIGRNTDTTEDYDPYDYKNNTFEVYWDGSVLANRLRATKGEIGPWNLSRQGFYSSMNSSARLLATGDLIMGNLHVSPNGYLAFGQRYSFDKNTNDWIEQENNHGQLYLDGTGLYLFRDQSKYYSSFTSAGIDLNGGRVKLNSSGMYIYYGPTEGGWDNECAASYTASGITLGRLYLTSSGIYIKSSGDLTAGTLPGGAYSAMYTDTAAKIGRVYITSSGMYIEGKNNIDTEGGGEGGGVGYAAMYTDSLMKLGDVTITPSQITVGKYGSGYQPVIINQTASGSSGAYASEFGIYSKAESTSNSSIPTVIGTMGYMESNTGTNEIQGQGIGIKVGTNIMKVNSLTSGFTTTDSKMGIYFHVGVGTKMYSEGGELTIIKEGILGTSSKERIKFETTGANGGLINLDQSGLTLETKSGNVNIHSTTGQIDIRSSGVINLFAETSAGMIHVVSDRTLIDNYLYCNKYKGWDSASMQFDTYSHFAEGIKVEKSLEFTGSPSSCIGIYATLA